MPPSQQQLDDLLERLIALTDQPDPVDQRDSLARLSLLLIEAVDDAARVQSAVDEVLAARAEPPPPAHPLTHGNGVKTQHPAPIPRPTTTCSPGPLKPAFPPDTGTR